ncbi:MAG: mechanosensitive ion channel protein [Firmicutes bacterium HGW-Firmicutes-15]|nr:MAG: mechanosensitive ion channel protein [Firmicutes bacterium HGW-Firmicutes-15]
MIDYPVLQWAALPMAIFIIFWLFSILFTQYILPIIVKLTSQNGTDIDEKILLAFARPIRVLIFILGIYLALRCLPLSSSQDVFLSHCFRSVLIIIIAWGVYALSGSDSVLSDEFKEKLKLDSILIPFFSKIIRFLIWAMAIVLIAQEWNYNVSGFIAGLGLGGLAFALAAKDALANIFGGIVIIMEKPFTIGDWVQILDVEGIVEEISFRSTRFRTFDQSVVTVPNSTLASQAITNCSRRGKRRVNFYLGIEYGTSHEKIEKCIQEIRDMLHKHPDIHMETILVYLENFSESSLDILIYYFTNTTVWKEYLSAKEDINIRILAILENENVSLAFPSRTIYIDNISADKIANNSAS